MHSGLRAVVLGASGFAGAELLRLLESHPSIQVVAAAAATQAGRPIADAYPNLSGPNGAVFATVEESLNLDCDIIFSSLPDGESSRLLGDSTAPKILDIAGDFRVKGPAWTYGLTEFHREKIRGADRVANPGCYPAAAILALGPLLEAGTVKPTGIHIDAKSGISGAGRAGGEGFDFASVNENTRAYAVTGHKHIPEMEQELTFLAASAVTLSFVPHLVPMTRGIVATCIADLASEVTTGELLHILQDRYHDEPFVRVLSETTLPETKRLSGTNLAEVTARVDARTGRAIAISAIDNLGKGAAGQALQNANLMLGFEETSGLDRGGMLP